MTLNLSEIDPPVWRVLVNDTAYGPYTRGQIQSFITEGRIGTQTKIASGDGAPFVAAETLQQLQPALRDKMVTKPRLRESDQADTPHNYIIIAKLSDLSDLGETNLTRCLNTLGRFGEAMPGVYVLQSTTKLSTIQKTLQTATTESDKVLVVDATANRLGWFNLGSEADIHLRSVWDKKLD